MDHKGIIAFKQTFISELKKRQSFLQAASLGLITLLN